MNIRSVFTEPSKTWYPVYRYGMLILILFLLAQYIRWYVTRPPGYDLDPYGTGVIVLMLLFNHLVFAFKWPKRVATALWVLAWSWFVFGFFYILYLSHALYPSSPSLLSW